MDWTATLVGGGVFVAVSAVVFALVRQFGGGRSGRWWDDPGSGGWTDYGM